jgi:hypothetical protein
VGFSAHARLLSFNENTTKLKKKTAATHARMQQQERKTQSKKESAKPHQCGVGIHENERQNHTAHPATNEKSRMSNTHQYTTTTKNRPMLRSEQQSVGFGMGFWRKTKRRRAEKRNPRRRGEEWVGRDETRRRSHLHLYLCCCLLLLPSRAKAVAFCACSERTARLL